MFRFVSVFLICLLLLFTLELLRPVQTHVILPFTGGVAHVSVWVMHLFDRDVIARQNDILSAASGGGIEIVAGCNGVEAVLILLSEGVTEALAALGWAIPGSKQVVYGVVLLGVVVFLPHGIWPPLARRLRLRP